MNWKFWKNQETEPRLQKPRELPELVGIYLVTRLKEDPDWAWSLRAVIRPQKNPSNHLRDIRIFSPGDAAAKAVAVRDYTSLDQHPDLILFQGWYDKANGTVQIEKVLQSAA